MNFLNSINLYLVTYCCKGLFDKKKMLRKRAKHHEAHYKAGKVLICKYIGLRSRRQVKGAMSANAIK